MVPTHTNVVHSYAMPTPARQGRQDQTREQQAMVEQGRRHPGVAEALCVFELASLRVPRTRAPQTVVRFATNTNA